MSEEAASAGAVGLKEKNWLGLKYANVKYRSQMLAYPYFIVSVILFVKQIIFGIIIASQYVWPGFLADSLPFNVGRASHLNLLVFWLLLGLIGASYYLIPEETESEIYSVKLGYIQLVILLIAGLGSMTSFWFLRDTLGSIGKPFTESPMPWPWFIAVGMVIFLVNIGVTILKSRRWNAISVILLGGMTGLSLLYLFDLYFFKNLVIDYYWWWWIIHLWVEGSWELIAAAVTAYLLVRLTGVDRHSMYKYLYAEVALVLFTGIIGTGHHYYWIGTPEYWLTWGAIFSFLEPIPIALMFFDAMMSMKRKKIQPYNKVAYYWLGAAAFGHLIGAGVWGIAHTLPQINKWTHGTQITASHGHAAFFGAFATIVLASIYYMVPKMKGLKSIREGTGLTSLILMCTGMSFMVLAFAFAGIVQTYLWRILGMDFMVVREEYVSFWIFWVWFFGLVFFLPGVILYVWNFFTLKEKPADSATGGGLGGS